MGLLSNLLLPGRLRTGPTVLLPSKVKPESLLEVLKLADPEAVIDDQDVLAAGVRVHAPLELNAELLRKLSIDGEERLWAHRVVGERPLPMDYYDKHLAAALAYRFGGMALCEGTPEDPAEDPVAEAGVYVPEMPEESELEVEGAEVSASYEQRFPAVVAGLMPYATELVKITVRSEEGVLEAGRLALELGRRLDGPVVDRWGFQVLEPEDLLPERGAKL